MKAQTFHWEMRTNIAMFENAFNDIVINRYNKDKEAKDKIHVDFKYAPKSRVLHDLVNKNGHIKLPVVAVSISGIQRSTKRVFNKIEGSHWFKPSTSTNDPKYAHLLQPVPVDITVNLSIIARFQTDIDQILTNFIPYCNPYVVVSWKWPEVLPTGDMELRSHIIWNDSVSLKYPIDITSNQPYRIEADTSFVIEGWMFKNSILDDSPIYKIDTTFTSVNQLGTYASMQASETDENTDYSTDYTVISAAPLLTIVSPFTAYVSQPTTFNLYGKMLDYTSSVYVSAYNWSIFNTTTASPLSAGVAWVDMMSGTNFTTNFPGFSGILVPSGIGWWSVNSNALQVSSMGVSGGVFDIIACNVAGYSQLTVGSIRPTTNPYPIDSPEYSSYVEYQYPCVNGIRLI